MNILSPPVFSFANIYQLTESPSSRKALKSARRAKNEIINIRILEFLCGTSNANEIPILGEYNESLCLVVSYDPSNNKLCIRTDKDDKLKMVNANDVTFIRAITADHPIPVNIDPTINEDGIGFLIEMDFESGMYKVKVSSDEYKETIISLKESQFKINTKLPYTKMPSPMTGQQTVDYFHTLLDFVNLDLTYSHSSIECPIESPNGWKMMGLTGPVYFNDSENAELTKIKDTIIHNMKDYLEQIKTMSKDTDIEQKLEEGYPFRPPCLQKQRETLQKIGDILKNLGANSDEVDRQINKITSDSHEPPFSRQTKVQVLANLNSIYDQLISPKQPIIDAKSR